MNNVVVVQTAYLSTAPAFASLPAVALLFWIGASLLRETWNHDRTALLRLGKGVTVACNVGGC